MRVSYINIKTAVDRAAALAVLQASTLGGCEAGKVATAAALTPSFTCTV
jgi:hypothetical protein